MNHNLINVIHFFIFIQWIDAVNVFITLYNFSKFKKLDLSTKQMYNSCIDISHKYRDKILI